MVPSCTGIQPGRLRRAGFVYCGRRCIAPSQSHLDPGTHNSFLNERGNTASEGILFSGAAAMIMERRARDSALLDLRRIACRERNLRCPCGD